MHTRQVFSFGVALALALILLLSGSLRAQEPGLHETFDNPELPGWERSPGVVVSDGLLRVPPNEFAIHLDTWSDFLFTARLRLSAGDGEAVVMLRASDEGSHHVIIRRHEIVLLRDQGGDSSEVGTVLFEELSEWFTLSVEASGDTYRIGVDDIPLLEATDAMIAPGGLGFHARGQLTLEVDELRLSEGEAPLELPRHDPAPASGVPAFEVGTWQRMGGPPGGLGYDIRMQPDNPDIMYVTDAHAGVHKSIDGGRTWFAANTGIGEAQSSIVPIFSLTIDPHDYNTIWAGTQNGGHIYRSTDTGATWQPRDNGISYEGRSVRGITVDPNNPDVVYAGVEVANFVWADEPRVNRHAQVMGEVYKSTDAGATWSQIWRGDNLARYVWVDPRNSQRVYVSTGIFDRDAAHSDVWAGEWGGVGVLRSDDGGQTWTVLDERHGLGGRYVTSLFMHPTNPDLLLASITGTAPTPGVYVTRNGGDSWEMVLDTQGWGIEAVEIAEADTDVWYAAGEYRIWRSDDAGATWQEFRIGTPDRDAGVPIDLQVDPRDPYRLFVNNYGGGNFLSEDGGETWVDASQGYTGLKMIGRLAVHPDDAQIVFGSGYRSDDGGQTWTGTQPRLTDGFGFYPLPDGVIASTSTGGVWHSTDGGVEWQETMVVDLNAEAEAGRLRGDILSMRSLAVAPDVAYVGFVEGACVEGDDEACVRNTPGLYRSRDGGHTWEAVNTPFNDVGIFTVTIDPADSRHVYVGTGTGLYESRDDGATWSPVTGITLDLSALIAVDPDAASREQTAPFIFDLEFDPFDGNTLYAGVVPGAIWRSTDGGATWTQAAAGMDPNEQVYEIVPDPTRPGVLYAATGLSGVYYSTDGGDTWRQLREGLTNTNVRGLALAADGGTLYAGTIGSGVFRMP